ncbi:MAG: hypothetical protein ACR2IK_05680 [Chloroflexota bacterium]
MTTSDNGQSSQVLGEPMFHRGILSLPEAASAASVSVAYFRRLARAGRLPFRARRDGTWSVDAGSFTDWLHSQRDTEVRSSPTSPYKEILSFALTYADGKPVQVVAEYHEQHVDAYAAAALINKTGRVLAGPFRFRVTTA